MKKSRKVKPEEVTLASVLASGGEMIEEGYTDKSVDGGIWNIYFQIWKTTLGVLYTFDCQGEDHGDTRVDHTCVEIDRSEVPYPDKPKNFLRSIIVRDASGAFIGAFYPNQIGGTESECFIKANELAIESNGTVEIFYKNA
tara:strand:- start:7902 stop:8324 length:423 start_codon:yes stop_codon:yes gene_type:complete